MFGANGVQVSSKTVWKERGGLRIDVENPNPGQRPGQIHLQDAEGNKYLFDPDAGTFSGAPNWVNDLLENSDFRQRVEQRIGQVLGRKCNLGEVILSFDEGEATVRFHKVRQSETPWVNLEALEKYGEAILIIEVG